jgi:hypothetical protein
MWFNWIILEGWFVAGLFSEWWFNVGLFLQGWFEAWIVFEMMVVGCRRERESRSDN